MIFFIIEKRPLVGIEKLAHHFVIFFCAILTILLLPFSLIFALKVSSCFNLVLKLQMYLKMKSTFSVSIEMNNWLFIVWVVHKLLLVDQVLLLLYHLLTM